jgi:ubiquinone/menaquinone biosynthesis C-methylase UbiE
MQERSSMSVRGSGTARYDEVGDGYDETRGADPLIVDRLSSHLELASDGTYLDVACGTGNYTVALAGRGGRWFGVDRSRLMLGRAREKSSRIGWQRGDVTGLPFRSGLFSGAVCTLAIHHFPALDAAFREVFRVLAGGRFVIFTSTPEQTAGFWLKHYFPDAIERSVELMPDLGEIRTALEAGGFVVSRTDPYEVTSELRDGFLYCGKHRPELYLSKSVRSGITTFRQLADPAEVESGCARLAEDIGSGRIEEVRAAHAHDHGDYLFVVATRNP